MTASLDSQTLPAALETQRATTDGRSGFCCLAITSSMIGRKACSDLETCLERNCQRKGLSVEFIRLREPWLGRLQPSPVGLGKWLGYFDKFIIFPWVLRRKIAGLRERHYRQLSVVVHICDHSNALLCRCRERAYIGYLHHDLTRCSGSFGER